MQHFGKSVVSTKNSTYTVDWDSKTVEGGRFTVPVSFTNRYCVIGSNMVLYLCNGSVLRTSTVMDVKEVCHETARKQQKGIARLFCFNRD